MANAPIEGGCCCGQVRFRTDGPVKFQSICFCGNCRRAVGAQSVAWVTFPAGCFSFLRGNQARYRTDTRRLAYLLPDVR